MSSVKVPAAVGAPMAVNERPKSELATSRARPVPCHPVPSPTSPKPGPVRSARSRDSSRLTACPVATGVAATALATGAAATVTVPGPVAPVPPPAAAAVPHPASSTLTQAAKMRPRPREIADPLLRLLLRPASVVVPASSIRSSRLPDCPRTRDTVTRAPLLAKTAERRSRLPFTCPAAGASGLAGRGRPGSQSERTEARAAKPTDHQKATSSRAAERGEIDLPPAGPPGRKLAPNARRACPRARCRAWRRSPAPGSGCRGPRPACAPAV
jgi:hypothetical protein